MHKAQHPVRCAALWGASAAALSLALAWSGAASAQVAPSGSTPSNSAPQTGPGGKVAVDPAHAADGSVEEIVVTSSRVERQGFEAPTPTTVVGATELRLGARSNIAAVLDDLPEVKATLNPTNTVRSAVQSGAQSVDLRGIGPTRTLVLLNAHRFVGDNDLNSVPFDLVKRVEVVTGGASADWGSGAIAGVVNILLDDQFEGGRINLQSGISTQGDGQDYRASAAFGSGFSNDRGHFMVDAEYYNNRGIYPLTSRDNVGGYAVLANPGFTATNGQHAFIISPNVGPTNLSSGGLITSGALRGQTFNPDGTTSAFNFGTLVGAAQSSGGSQQTNDAYSYLTVPISRANVFGRATYDLTSRIKLYADIRYADVFSHYNFAPDTSAGNITIRNDNAFLPTAIRSQLAAAGQTSFLFGRNNDDFEFRDYDYNRQDVQGTLGAQGSFGPTWKWDGYYTHGERTVQEVFNNQRVTANFNLAVDSVISPTTGQPICRIALTVPTTNCVPINLFGYGAPSQAAINYVNGSSLLRFVQKLDVGGATLRGEPFSVWAGPVSFATGAEFRRESIQTLEEDPVARTNGFTTVNPKGFDGSFDVKEAFAETVVPVVKDLPFLKLVEINAAGRVSDFSNSGTVWAWKAGVTAHITQDLLLRAVRSRDTRSASLTELFTQGTSSTSVINDPVTKTQYSVTAQNGGNPNLLPELADTTTFGFTYSPSWVRGLSFSVDHYDILIDRAITTLSGQDIVTRCATSNPALCSQVTRGAGNLITAVRSTFINLATYKTRGTDFEASYTLPLARLWSGAEGRLNFRALANHVDSLATNDGVTAIQYAGTVGTGVSFGAPRWQASLTSVYNVRDTNISVRARYVGGGLFNPALDIANNVVSSRTYVDVAIDQDLGIIGRKGLTLYGNINNLFDRSPPPAPNPQFYDVVGRYFEIGVRARF